MGLLSDSIEVIRGRDQLILHDDHLLVQLLVLSLQFLHLLCQLPHHLVRVVCPRRRRRTRHIQLLLLLLASTLLLSLWLLSCCVICRCCGEVISLVFWPTFPILTIYHLLI